MKIRTVLLSLFLCIEFAWAVSPNGQISSGRIMHRLIPFSSVYRDDVLKSTSHSEEILNSIKNLVMSLSEIYQDPIAQMVKVLPNPNHLSPEEYAKHLEQIFIIDKRLSMQKIGRVKQIVNNLFSHYEVLNKEVEIEHFYKNKMLSILIDSHQGTRNAVLWHMYDYGQLPTVMNVHLFKKIHILKELIGVGNILNMVSPNGMDVNIDFFIGLMNITDRRIERIKNFQGLLSPTQLADTLYRTPVSLDRENLSDAIESTLLKLPEYSVQNYKAAEGLFENRQLFINLQQSSNSFNKKEMVANLNAIKEYINENMLNKKSIVNELQKLAKSNKLHKITPELIRDYNEFINKNYKGGRVLKKLLIQFHSVKLNEETFDKEIIKYTKALIERAFRVKDKEPLLADVVSIFKIMVAKDKSFLPKTLPNGFDYIYSRLDVKLSDVDISKIFVDHFPEVFGLVTEAELHKEASIKRKKATLNEVLYLINNSPSCQNSFI